MDKRIKPFTLLDHQVLPFKIGYCLQNDPPNKQKCHKCRGQLEVRITVLKYCETNLYHVKCFFEMMSRDVIDISIDHFLGIDGIDSNYQKQLLTEVRKYHQLEPTQPESRKYFIRAEENESIYIPSENRTILFLHMSKVYRTTQDHSCKNCNQTVQKGHFCFEINHKMWHPECSLQLARIIVGNLEQMDGFDSLDKDIQEKLMMIVEEKKNNFLLENNIDSNFLTALGYPDHFVPVLSVMNAFIWNAEITVECKKCNQEIKRGELVFHYHNQNMHPSCAFCSAKIIVDEPEDIPGWKEFPDNVKKTTRMNYDLALIFEDIRAVSFNCELTLDKNSSERIFEEKAEEPDCEERSAKIRKLEPGLQTTNKHYTFMEQISTLRELVSKYEFLSNETILKVFEHNRIVPITNPGQERFDLMRTILDNMIYGVPDPCLFCFGSIARNIIKRTYKCNGYASPFSKCNYRSRNPTRQPIQIPASCDEFFDSADFNKFQLRLYVDDNYEAPLTNYLKVPPEATELPTYSSFPALRTKSNTKYLRSNRAAIPHEFGENFCILGDVTSGDLFEAFLTNVEVQDNRNSCIQLYILHSEKKQEFVVLKRQSRIGTDNAMKKTWTFKKCEKAITHFETEFYDATENHWKNRKKFVKIAAKYNNVLFTYDDLNFRNDILAEFVAKNQLAGRITDSSREVLQNMLNQLEANLLSGKLTEFDFIDVTNKFYSMFPVCSGFLCHEIINNRFEIEKAQNLLNEYAVVNVSETNMKVRLDLTLKHESYQIMKYLNPDSDDWKTVAEYCHSTQGATHNTNLRVIDIVRVEQPRRFYYRFPGKNVLLWHGTRRENIESILKNGLMLDPPAVRTGAMFGRGIYFADCVSKSFNYSNAKDGTDAYLFLCEVALGHNVGSTTEPFTDEKVLLAQIAGHTSIQGIGKSFPSTSKMVNNVLVPQGPLLDLPTLQSNLQYNEYIVYDEKRVSLRYLVRVRAE